MKEKLIELLIEADDTCQSYEAFADSLLESGIIVPPAKVGDVVYSYFSTWRKEDGIVPYQITNISITQNKKGVWIKKYGAMQVVGGIVTPLASK